MANWIEEYPHKIYASVLLLDDELIDYKIGQRCWQSPIDVTLRGQISLEDLFKCKTRFTYWEANNLEEHEKIFEKLGKDWIKEQANLKNALQGNCDTESVNKIRLIDADKLIKDIEHSNLDMFLNGEILKFIKETINNQPTVSNKAYKK